MSMWLYSQILAVFATILFIISISCNTHKYFFGLSSVEIVLNITKNILLGGYSGAVVQMFGLIRSLLAMTNKFQGIVASIIIACQIAFGLYFNNHGLVGVLPILATVVFSITVMKTSNMIYIKYALVVNLLLWCTYNIALHDYVGFITNLSYAIYTVAFIVYCTKQVVTD